MATLKDISAELGLSVTTVSRALNGFPEVNAKTRAAVEEVAKRFNYQPNRLAQKLVSGRSGMVGMVVRLDPARSTDRSFVEIIIGLSARLAEHDIDLVFHVESGGDQLAPYRRLIAKNTLDGFILNSPLTNDPRIPFLRNAGIPFVLHGSSRSDNGYAFYDIDNFAVTEQAVRLLADLGHRRIAMMNGDVAYAFAAERERGFRQTLGAMGLTTPDAFILHGHGSEDDGYTGTLAMLSGRLGPPPTAIICSTTAVASGVLRAARDKGVSVPHQLSVFAHDDALPALEPGEFDPPLTVTRAPLRDSCIPLADKLVAMLDGRKPQDLQTTIRPEIIIRKSTGPVPVGGDMPWQ